MQSIQGDKGSFRVLARDLAHELSINDLHAVGGGEAPVCKEIVTVTNANGATDYEVTCVCSDK